MTNPDTKALLTHDFVTRHFKYDPTTGIFSRISLKGRPTGRLRKDGYVYIGIGKTNIMAHRLAWLYMFGTLPSGMLDHIDGNRANNAISNLRIADNSKNAMNSGIRRTNTSGFRGVCRRNDGRYWAAMIRSGGARLYLGCFTSPEAASAAYEAKAREIFGEFAARAQFSKKGRSNG